MEKRKFVRSKPQVSVIMPVYNAQDYLPEAIESILRQTYKNFEFIIVDDASTDRSWQIIRKYERANPGIIRAIRLTKNLNCGGDACANAGFRKARGKYIARMDADDIAHPDRLLRQVQYLEKHRRIIVLGTQAYVINKEGKITGEKSEPTTDKDIRENYFIFHPMIHPSVMIRRRLLPKRKNLYKISYNANNDLLTFFGLLQKGQFANLPEKLLYYRIHGHNDSLIDPKGRFLNTVKIRWYAWRRLGYRPSLKALLINLLQAIIILTMPASLITHLYMIWRGLSKPRISSAKMEYATAYS
jgi:glycosyltransferase involved in cell wall biosynthesis